MSRGHSLAFDRSSGRSSPGFRLGGFGVAILAVAAGLAVRVALERSGSLHYLVMLPAVVVTALLTGRRETGFTIVLTVIASLAFLHSGDRPGGLLNELLFVLIAWITCEGIWRLRAQRQRAVELSRTLARRDQMLHSIFASTPIVTLDHLGIVRSLTPSASTILAASESLAVGEPFSLFVDDFDLKEVGAGAEGGGQTGTVWSARRGDGGRSHLNIQVGINGDVADPDHAVLCLTDLTESYAADAYARDLHAQLNRVWRLNSLGEMAASLSHELNQPLSAAVTYLHAAQADMKSAGPVADNAGRTVDMAKGQLLRAGEIIRRMRELLVHETRSMNVESVGSMIADLNGVIGMIARTGVVAVELQIAEDDDVWAERIQFQQAMVNLVRNAVEALEGRPDPRIVITGKVVSPETYEIRVEDNGAGIATADMETIFRPLMSTKSGGMGLGLSVTRTIIDSHGGVLKVEASPLGGAAFSFCLMRERELVET